ncbi:hypothetical protein DJ84_11635 [Halorubrum ezzemoulense]|nr:hypothetical protein DJ84_11635 [Halorubrum ezzemoulense]
MGERRQRVRLVAIPARQTLRVGAIADELDDRLEPDDDVEVELSSPEDGWIEVSVRDDGPGLPQMEADALETGEETPLNHGNGLGLWMVRMITTQAGGDISVRTAEAGTDVRLRVPTE